MRVYEVSVIEDDEVLGTRYAGTQADARATRDELMSKFGVKKKDVSIKEIEVPTDKAGLLEFINGVAAAADLEEGS